jgi:hypothetical protein
MALLLWVWFKPRRAAIPARRADVAGRYQQPTSARRAARVARTPSASGAPRCAA